jgi:hypothetical protein
MTATHERQGQHVVDPLVRDEAVRLAPEGQLVGILSHPPTYPSDTPARPDRPGRLAFIILNAGVLHRVGPHRLHVTLARRIAAGGIPALRLDLGGIGDSIASSDATSFRDSAIADTRAAMNDLTRLVGAERFVLFGVCAGADNSIGTALADDRVAGIVLVDPPTYPTRRGQLRYLRTRIAERGGAVAVMRWSLTVAERRLRLAIAMLGRGTVDDPPSEGRELPPVPIYRTQLTTLVDRGVRVFSIFSGIHGARYSHRDQLFELFPSLRGRLDHAYFPDANHTFTELAVQGELIDTIAGWMTRRFCP